MSRSPKVTRVARELAAVIATTIVVAAGCSAGSSGAPATTGPGPSVTVGTQAPATAPHTAPPSSTSTTAVAPVPPPPGLGPQAPSAPVAPPAGSPIVNIRRDCGMSTPLTGGRLLWIYCDTGLFGADQRLRYFLNTSAAVSASDAPTVMLDNVDAAGMPLVFMQPLPEYPVCSAAKGEKPSVWPISAVTIPAHDGEPRDRVLVYYSNVCLVPGGATTFDVGVAEAWFATGADASPRPLAVSVLHSRLFPKLGAGGSYGAASFVEGDDIYVYWCDLGFFPCTVGRVNVAGVADPVAYRFWNGTGWVADRAAATPVTGPSVNGRIKPSIRWVPALDRYVLVDIDAWNMLEVRQATRPEGPWSEPGYARLGDCHQTFPNNCFAVEIHPELSDAANLAVSYFDPTRPFDGDATTRLAMVPFDASPEGT